MSAIYGENNLVQGLLGDLLESLGWQVLNAGTSEQFNDDRTGVLSRMDSHEVVLKKFLFPALRRINPKISNTECDLVYAQIANLNQSAGILDNNKLIFGLYLNGVTVTTTGKNGRKIDHTYNLIDFNTITNNNFVAVREFQVSDKAYNRRADVVCFINGLPIVFVELKRDDIDIYEAYHKNYRDYKDSIPHLFYYTAFEIMSNGRDSRVGTVGSPWQFFSQWKRLNESDEDGEIGLERMANGMLSKQTLLDLIENYILFDHSKGKLKKILARNHQYLGVNNAICNYKNRETLSHRLGVFWHTQGSGKSYSMIFLARKIFRKFSGKRSIIVLTDREELNDQIANQFISTGCIAGEAKNYIAQSGTDLMEKIREGRKYIFTLIHKFNNDREPAISNDTEYIIFSDEAHRTQYGNFASNADRILPGANWYGFTGTPLLKGDKTALRFGDYVSRYDFGRAISDQATVPLYYVNRSHLEGLDEYQKDIFNSQFEETLKTIENYDSLKPEQRAKLEKAVIDKVFILISENRLRIIAKDFVEHYSESYRAHNAMGKAMVVSVLKVASLRMFLYSKEYWKEKIAKEEAKLNDITDQQAYQEQLQFVEWMKSTQMQFVISNSQNEIAEMKEFGIDIKKLREEQSSINLADDFKDKDNPLRIVFVCAMWLTGFDVPCLSTIYIDKLMKDHTLMQTIARANRVHEGKENGLIIDYIGIIDALSKALQEYSTSDDDDDDDDTQDPDGGKRKGKGKSLIKKLDELLSETRELITDKIIPIFQEDPKEKYDIVALSEIDTNHNDKAIRVENKKKVLIALRNLSAYLLKTKNRKQKFQLLMTKVKNNVEILITNHIQIDFISVYNFLCAILNRMHEEVRDADVSEIMARIDGVMNRHLEVKESEVPFTPIDISQIKFPKKITEQENNLCQAIFDSEAVKDKIEEQLRKLEKVSASPSLPDFFKEYNEIIKDYNASQDYAEIIRKLQELIAMSQKMTKEQRRWASEGFDNEYQLAVFDLLNDKKLKPEQVDILKTLSKDIINQVTERIKNIDNWRDTDDKQTSVRQVIRRTLYRLPEEYRPEIIKYSQIIFDYIYNHNVA